MAFVRTNGVLLHYRVHGSDDAPVVALVNSLGTDARIWDATIEFLSTGYRVLSYDKRGHGLSDAPPHDYTLSDHVDDLVRLLEHVGISRLALAGVSVGGMIAQGFALRYRDRLAALVLCDTAPRIGTASSWNDRIAAVRENGLAAIADGIMERWFSARYRREHGDDVAGWRNLFLRGDPAGYCSTCATVRDTDLTGEAAEISTPTLVVVGSEDGSTPVETVRSAAATIPGARFEIIPGAGHIPSIEQPEALAALMTSFFKEVGHG
ncbi:MAG: 3-oxoadipate enol-lactonase [Reyranella sp.]|nr:3-oxoadipate enol-lactonase [Reyranella sp.]